MNIDLNRDTKRSIAVVSALVCAIGGLCAADLFHASSEVTVGFVVVGLVMGYSIAFINVALSFALILVSSVLILGTCSQMAKRKQERQQHLLPTVSIAKTYA